MRKNFFIVGVLLSLIFSAAFALRTSNAGGSSTASVKAWPPDVTHYARPAISGDLSVSRSSEGFTSPGFFVTEVPGSPGGEPDISINPTNQNQIVIHAGFGGWNGNASNFISTDGGLTWTTSPQIPPPPGAPNTIGCPCDVTQDWGVDGVLYGTYLTGNTDVFSASFIAGFFNYFGNPAQLTDFNGTLGFADQPWLLTNKDPVTVGQTNTYVAYDDFAGAPNERVSVANTSPPAFVTDNISGFSTGFINPGHRLATDSRTGFVYDLWQQCVANCGTPNKTINYILNRSENAGTTWGFPGFPNGVVAASGVTVQPQPKFGTVNALLGGIDHAAVDPTTGNVFVVFGGNNGAAENAVFIREITFDNASPSNPILNAIHQVSLPGAQAALPSVAVAPDGTVGVLYTSFDGFSVDGFPIFTGHFGFSTDQGATFTDKSLLTFLSPAKDNGDPRQRVLGDFQQLKTVNGTQAGATFYGAFTGNGAALGDPTANNDAIFFKVALAPQINITPPPALGESCSSDTLDGTLQVANTGADELVISSIKCTGSPDISILSGPTFPVTISPDANFDFTVQCIPQSFGPKSATCTINSNDPANPAATFTATCNVAGGAAVISVPAGLTFAPTVIQQDAACSAELGVPISNNGVCPANVTAVGITQAGADYSLTGLPKLPASVPPGGQLGAGDLKAIFAPLAVTRTSTGSVDVTFETDPILHTTTTKSVPLCGEATQRGVRVLVTVGGVPATLVNSIKLEVAIAPEQHPSGPFGPFFLIANAKNVAPTTVSPSGVCPGFTFHTEYGGASDPIQLKEGTYRVVVKIKGHKKQIVRFVVDPCSFTPLIVVPVP
jgi:hypothetical protein